jgi:hypothetical protein
MIGHILDCCSVCWLVPACMWFILGTVGEGILNFVECYLDRTGHGDVDKALRAIPFDAKLTT